MGIHGLWSIIEPAGKPVPLESLENKILAVDVSIWLNQAVKGYRDKSGNAVANAHLLGLFHRISKLLFYKIKPVFVFDGKAPDLKKETLHRRRIRKGDASKKARTASAKILDNYVRSQAVASQLKQQTHAVNKILAKGQGGLHEVLASRAQKRDKDLFELPPLPDPEILEDLESDNEDDDYKEDLLSQMNLTIHNLDVSSQSFKALPKEMQYEVLSELNERRKQSSWGKMHEMPQSGSSFSGFQMQRLINRSNVYKKRDQLGKEIGEENACQLEPNLFVGDVQGLKKAKAEAKKIQSSSSGQHFVYLKGLKDTGKSKEAASGSTSNIQNANASSSKQAEEFDDGDVEILEPTIVKLSNRSGGILPIKQETISEESDDDGVDIYQEEILKVIRSEAKLKGQVASQSGLSSKQEEISESSSEEDDTFEEVISGEEPRQTQSCISIEIMPDLRVSKEDDLFADIFVEEKVSNMMSPLQPSKSLIQEHNSEEAPMTSSSTRVMAEEMKQSDHSYLKIVSKYVEQPEEKKEGVAIPKDVKDDKLFDELDKDTDKLISEMKMNAREERLMKIKDLDQLQAEESKMKNSKEMRKKITPLDSNLLDDLGVKQIDQEEYTHQVEKDLDGDRIYGDAVAGFSRSKKDAAIVLESEISNVEGPNIFDQNLMAKLDNEEAEEFSRDELIELQNKLAEEQEGLIAERGQLDRLAASITDQMYAECQDLLQLFGIPWIVAPSEAEAQCAFLDMNGMTHGTITDDSDVWAFGGQRIFKHFFNQDKHCEYFSSADVGQHFGLSRQRLIMLAMLTGSDYTDGIDGVGAVTALEILAEFGSEGNAVGDDLQPLNDFKSWWDEHHKNHNTLPPGSKLREKLRKLQVPEVFPSERVKAAYMNPEVDNSTEKFTWAIPNFVDIRDFATEKFGWTRGKIDEIIKPVIKKMGVRSSQERIDNFFLSSRSVLPEKGKLASKRVKDAINRVLGQPESASNPVKKTKRKTPTKKDDDAQINGEPSSAKLPKRNTKVTLVQSPRDWKKEDELKKQEAKKKAVEVMKKQASKKKEKKKCAYRNRKVLPQGHDLSSDSD